ncbi:MAG: hypothetical protein GXO69_05040 [Acidobacteria bacterium]|nr:hypothetical protein [Acidobacteriota bacterium]
MNIQEIAAEIQSRWNNEIKLSTIAGTLECRCHREHLVPLCGWLFNRLNCHFAGLTAEELPDRWNLDYLFTPAGESGIIRINTAAPLKERNFPSISIAVHAADWHEREAEDLFGLTFEGHPRLGDFILHDDAWQEGVEPMRENFSAADVLSGRNPKPDWRPRRILKAPGAFIMPVGPVFSGEAESVHFQLETIGEEVLRAFPRLFFKYRGVEKLAEGRSVDNGLLLAERFAGSTAFSHALAFSMAIEKLSGEEVPPRAEVLRVFMAELERLRHHLGVIEGICSSTGLAVGTGQCAILEEEALRISGALTGHRYLFGLCIPGGLSRDFDKTALKSAAERATDIVRRMNSIEKLLINTSSFLDRLEEVGAVTEKQAHDFGLAGPVARASGYSCDTRKQLPYGAYRNFDFDSPHEREGDGYARLRLFFAEVRESGRIMEQAAEKLPPGKTAVPCNPDAGTAISTAETPRGATWHRIRIGTDGKIKRYRLITPSFANWHGFHIAAENFAFQDFPIILATFGLSVAENDR